MKYWVVAFVLIGASLFAMRHWVIPAFIFHPTKELRAKPLDIGLDYEDVRLQTPDGETLAGWHIPAAPDTSAPGQGLTLLFFHGNAGNISHLVESIAFFHKLGLSVFIIDYRGFGESTGKASVNGTIRDAWTAWQWLTGSRGVPASRIILFGRSLGGGVAAALAARVTPKALILESTFTSLHDMGKKTFPWLPKFLFLEEYATINNIQMLHAPLLVVHSPDDKVINFSMGREIFDSYKGPKSFLQIHGSHGRGWFLDLAVYEAGIRGFIEKLRSGNP
jgi:fermentation-respiration switch protein FrsA (DUF1100 family)